MAIELIVQHIRDFLNNRGRSIEAEAHRIADNVDDAILDEISNGSSSTTPVHGKKKNETHSHNMHRPH